MRRRRFIQNSAFLATGGILGWFGVDRATAIKQGLPSANLDYVTVKRPSKDDVPFGRSPIAASYADRKRLYLDWASMRPTPDHRGGLLNDLLKFEAGVIEAPSPAALNDALNFVNARLDPSDFTVGALIRLYSLHRDDGFLTSGQVNAISAALLGYKYRLSGPGQSQTEMWTENHQIMSHGSDYLAGQLFPGAIFSNDCRTGREHMETARTEILRWLSFHAETGFAEWNSIPYYNMDIAALLNLAEFAQDEQVQTRAVMMVDSLLFDLAVNSFYGQMGSSHGRAYAGNVLSAAGDSLLNLQTLVFGYGRFQSVDMASTMLVTGKRYLTPPVLEAIGVDTPDELLNYQRHSIQVTADAAKRWNIDLSDDRDFEIWWGMGAFTTPEVIDLTVDAINGNNLWHYKEFKPLHAVSKVLRPLDALPAASRVLSSALNGPLMSEVNKICYRTPDGMLSTAQDYRPGEPGYQQHIWQATLGPYAVVFVTNPGMQKDGAGPGYWSSNGRMPRNGQYRNALISVYKVPRHCMPFPFAARPIGYTHAYFPRWAFDEVVESAVPGGGGWVFGRRGDGYVALYSHLSYQWTASGPEAGQEIGVPGFENIWICQIGRKTVDGSFADFVRTISQSHLEVKDLNVIFTSPGNGELQFGWEGPLTLNHEPISLRDYPRWANLYTHADFGVDHFHFQLNQESLDLDFSRGSRALS